AVALSVPGGSPVSVPANVTVPGGSSTVNFTMTTSGVTTNTPVTLTANLRGTIKTFTVTVTPPQIVGHVTLGEFGGSTAGMPISIQVRNPGSSTVLDTIAGTLDASGNFSVGTTRVGTFDVAVKASHWLRNLQSNVAFGSLGATGVSLTL